MSRFLGHPTSTTAKLTTSFTPCRLHEVVSWQAEAYRLPAHSLVGHGSVRTAASTTTAWGTANRNIARDEPCFITKDLAYVLQRAHWINAVRDNNLLKTMIEYFLGQRGIVRPFFDLNDPTNLTNLSPMLHAAMDKFDMFAITCSETSLDALSDLVQAENAIWQAKINELQNYTRNFPFSEAPMATATYEIVVLHKKHFLPNGRCIVSYASGIPELFAMADDGVLRRYPITESSARFPSFSADNAQRAFGHLLNPFLVILAAEVKFRRFLRWRATLTTPEPLDPVHERLIAKTINLAHHLYAYPVPDMGTAARTALDSQMDVDDSSRSAASGSTEFGVLLSHQVAGGDSTARLPGAAKIRRSGLSSLSPADFGRNLLFGHANNDLTHDDEELRRELLCSQDVGCTDFVAKVQAWQEHIAV